MAATYLMKIWKQGSSLIVTVPKDMVRRLRVTKGDYLMGYVTKEGILVASKHELTRTMMETLKHEREDQADGKEDNQTEQKPSTV